MKNSSTQITGLLSLITATLLYGLFGVLSRVIGFSIPLFYASGIRSLTVAALSAPLLLFLKHWRGVTKRDFLWITIRSIFGVIALIAFIVAVNYMPIGTVYFIFYAGSTIGGFILGRLLFSERMNAVKTVSLLLSLAGLSLIYSLNVEASTLTYVYISMLSGVTTALWNSLSKKISHTYSPLLLGFYDNLIGGTLALLCSLFIINETWITPSLTVVWGANLLYSLFQIATGVLVVYGFRRLDVQIGSLILLAEVLFGILFGFVLYGETLTLSMLAGGLMILGGIVIPEIYMLRKRLVKRHDPL